MLADERDALVESTKVMDRRRLQTRRAQCVLAEGAVVFQPLAEGAAADDAEAVAAEMILLVAEIGLLEDDEAVAADPAELGPPICRPRNDSFEDPGAIRAGGEDAHLVPAEDQAPVQVAQVVRFAHAQDAHAATVVRKPPMAKTLIDGVSGLKSLVGKDLGTSPWKEMTFDAIRKFADATGDHQWIHVDKERIARESPFGKPIAHGYFTVSLIAGLFFELVEVRNCAMVINYGLNKVRFPAPMKEGQRYRLGVRPGDVKEIGNGVEGLLNATVEIEGEGKPACVAELVYRFYGS